MHLCHAGLQSGLETLSGEGFGLHLLVNNAKLLFGCFVGDCCNLVFECGASCELIFAPFFSDESE